MRHIKKNKKIFVKQWHNFILTRLSEIQHRRGQVVGPFVVTLRARISSLPISENRKLLLMKKVIKMSKNILELYN
jgi:hypothetical protein